MVPAKVSDDGLVLRTGPGATPVPDSGTLLAIPDAVMARFPVRVPVAVGAKVTLIVHEPPAAIDEPQVLVWLKSPVVEIPVTGAVAVPLLLTVTVCGLLVEPVAWVPKPTAV